MTQPTAKNLAALEPLYQAWEEPNKHRVRAKKEGLPPEIKNYRRESPLPMVNRLRADVREWRETNYPGASETTRYLLRHWFERDHTLETPNGTIPFRYYFCQREAIETFIYLMEVRGTRNLTELVAAYGGPDAEKLALGVNPDDDRWARYAFKLATGAGKTKCMSLAMVWSYFHAKREDHSPMAQHFVVIAPNLTVFERLKEDFRPEEGGPDVFEKIL
jgi:Type III restriction enzyme, res subunit.